MEMNCVPIGGMIICPIPTQEVTIPVINPIFLVNHLVTVDVIGTAPPLRLTPTIIPQNIYSCHKLLVCDIKKQPRPNRQPQTVAINLGPNLSHSLPAKIPRKPVKNMLNDWALEVISRVQPNSSDNGLKKTP